ncbi:MAG: hypothetical protein AAFQ58_10165 [Pseudomonadota bacterium]
MTVKMTKTPMMIAALAAAVTLGSTSVARAGGPATVAAIDSAEVVQANFKIKKRGFHHKRGLKHRGFHRHRSFHQRGFRGHHRGFKHRGHIHRPKHRSRIVIKKRF